MWCLVFCALVSLQTAVIFTRQGFSLGEWLSVYTKTLHLVSGQGFILLMNEQPLDLGMFGRLASKAKG